MIERRLIEAYSPSVLLREVDRYFPYREIPLLLLVLEKLVDFINYLALRLPLLPRNYRVEFSVYLVVGLAGLTRED